MICELKKTGVCGIVDHEYTIATDFITLPQMVIHWFVGCMMPKWSIAIVPNRSYDSGKDGSIKENVWLAYLNKLHGHSEGNAFVPITSRYCMGSTQKRVRRFFFDGFRELTDKSRECYEFYGCYYHRCRQCFPDHSKVLRC